MIASTVLLSLVTSTFASDILWDGRLNAYQSSAFLNNWSWSNPVGPYQYYIHGSGSVSEYVKLASKYKNPADSGSKRGIQITIDKTSVWNSDNMLRTELIPQTSAPINQGKAYYHFSMQHTGLHPPSPYEEHQVCFFESHFTEMKYGLISGEQGTEDKKLQWMVNGVSHWSTVFRPSELKSIDASSIVSFASSTGIWHNIAYGIDFDSGSVTFYHSTGGKSLSKVAGPIAVSASSNGADWHLGVLRLPSSTGRTNSAPEDWHFSGVYIESGGLTTSVSG